MKVFHALKCSIFVECLLQQSEETVGRHGDIASNEEESFVPADRKRGIYMTIDFSYFKFLLIFKHCCIIKIMIFVLASMPTRTSSSCDRKTSKTHFLLC